MMTGTARTRKIRPKTTDAQPQTDSRAVADVRHGNLFSIPFQPDREPGSDEQRVGPDLDK